MLNGIVLLYSYLFLNFGLAIIVFTLLIRVIMLPLTNKQLKSTKAMMAIQPKMKEMQQRYAKDKQKLAQEQMRLYKEYGVNPLGCLGPMLIQFPIWIGLYQAIIQVLPQSPNSLMDLSSKLYSWLPQVHTVGPLNSRFLWLDLA